MERRLRDDFLKVFDDLSLLFWAGVGLFARAVNESSHDLPGGFCLCDCVGSFES
jgi:hypothetical protein